MGKMTEALEKSEAEKEPSSKKEKLKKVINEQSFEPSEKKERKKTVRRTKEQLESDRRAEVLNNSEGYQIFAEVIKSFSDSDCKKYGLEKCSAEEFYPIAKNYSIIYNYFFKAKNPIYFVCVSAGVQTFMMLKKRSELIDAKMGKNEQSSNLDNGEKGFGQKFPSEEDIKPVSK